MIEENIMIMIRFNPTHEDFKEMENFLKNQDNDIRELEQQQLEVE